MEMHKIETRNREDLVEDLARLLELSQQLALNIDDEMMVHLLDVAAYYLYVTMKQDEPAQV